MPVAQISSLDELKQKAATPRLVVVDAKSSWCGPCKAIAPFVEELSRKYAAVTFLQFDVDECQDLAAALGIRAMPTFVFFKSGKEVDRMEGASPAALEEKVKQHGANAAAFEGHGRRLGETTTATTANTTTTTTASSPSQHQHAPIRTAAAEQQQQQQERLLQNWPLEVPPNETVGKVLLQTPDGIRNPLKVAPNVHTVADLYKAVAIMLERSVDSFVLSVREGTKPVDLKKDDFATTLKDARVAGGAVLLRNR